MTDARARPRGAPPAPRASGPRGGGRASARACRPTGSATGLTCTSCDMPSQQQRKPKMPASASRSQSPRRTDTSESSSRRGLRRVGITIMCLALSGGLIETFVPGGLVRCTLVQNASEPCLIAVPSPVVLVGPAGQVRGRRSTSGRSTRLLDWRIGSTQRSPTVVRSRLRDDALRRRCVALKQFGVCVLVRVVRLVTRHAV